MLGYNVITVNIDSYEQEVDKIHNTIFTDPEDDQVLSRNTFRLFTHIQYVPLF